MHCLMHWLDAMFDPWPPFTFCRPQAIVRTQEFRFQTHLPSPARRGSRSRPPLRRPRPLRFERLRVPVWNPYSRGRLSPAKSEDRKGGEGKTDANLTIFFSTCCARDIHMILDNYGTHTYLKVQAWFAAHPRYHLHFTPTGTSWLNLVERWFAEITRKRIRRGTFRCVAELTQAIYQYVRENNNNPRPFIWTATASNILRKIKHCKEALDAGH